MECFWAYLMAESIPAVPNSAVPSTPRGGGSSTERWSSQMMAGRSALPSLSMGITVLRWVVMPTPAMAALSMVILLMRPFVTVQSLDQ
ncbi:MAG: hypothetical protein BWX71_02036 [Deltaproteobacteria bacterium ADurb.Bin072]|nr:MAG: hypothetical protein BWX71_02036 [Deltaproteobacteria bacterium ADurb.Bin072]